MRPISAKVALALTALISIALLASCATSSGAGKGTATAVETGETPPTQPVRPNYQPTGSPVTEGLQIVTDPDNAEVFLNGSFQGRTPLVIKDLYRGTYRLQIRKRGYREVTSWIDYPGDYMLFQTPLSRITGFLRLSVSPQDAEVLIGGIRFSPGLIELPEGTYGVLVRAFGYTQYSEPIEISDVETRDLDVSLSPVPFSFTRVRAGKKTINPEDPGVLGVLEIVYSVSGPGTGEVSVFGPDSRLILQDPLPEFATWNYRYLWRPVDPSGGQLPDGDYRIAFSGTGSDETRDEKQITIRIDHGTREAPRSLWSGSAGLLYAPTSDILPDGGYQLSFFGAAGSSGSGFQAPFQFSTRCGIGDFLEIDGEVATVLSSTTPFSIGIAARHPLVKAARPFGFGVAGELKAAFQITPSVGVLTTDVFSNFSGLSLGFPLAISLGPVSLLAEPSVIASLWRPFDTDTPPEAAFVSWFYLRGGVLLDLGEFSGGISFSARTNPMPGGAAGFAEPFQTGFEAHWLVPDTHVVLSGALLLSFERASEARAMAGGGLGFIY